MWVLINKGNWWQCRACCSLHYKFKLDAHIAAHLSCLCAKYENITHSATYLFGHSNGMPHSTVCNILLHFAHLMDSYKHSNQFFWMPRNPCKRTYTVPKSHVVRFSGLHSLIYLLAEFQPGHFDMCENLSFTRSSEGLELVTGMYTKILESLTALLALILVLLHFK